MKKNTQKRLCFPKRNNSKELGIFFPVGKPPRGTCEFATKECLKECISFKNPCHYDTIGIEPKLFTINYFKNHKTETIIKQLLYNYHVQKGRILCWFMSGDCPEKLTNKITSIIVGLKWCDIPQRVITRNPKLYSNLTCCQNEYGGVKLGVLLTIDSESEAVFDIWYAIPNYKTSKMYVYHDKMVHHVCGGSETENINYPVSSCIECMNENKGCFEQNRESSRREKTVDELRFNPFACWASKTHG